MVATKWISLDVRDDYTPDYYKYMDIHKYNAVCLNNRRCTVYAKTLSEAKALVFEKAGCEHKEIYRV